MHMFLQHMCYMLPRSPCSTCAANVMLALSFGDITASFWPKYAIPFPTQPKPNQL